MENIEIEVKFLEIDKDALIKKLLELGADDKGEELITQEIFHDPEKKWYAEHKFCRIRKTGKGIFFTYKHVQADTATGTTEIEFALAQPEKMKAFLEHIGLVMDRSDEKRRHKFMLGEVVVDIDTWPTIPTYVELEGPSEAAIKDAADKLGFDWSRAVFGTADMVIKERYKLDLSKVNFFTFEKIG